MMHHRWRQRLLFMLAAGCGVIASPLIFAEGPTIGPAMSQTPSRAFAGDLSTPTLSSDAGVIQQTSCLGDACCEPTCGSCNPATGIGCDDGCDARGGNSAAKKKAALAAKVAGAYKGVYYDNDFSYLNDPAYKSTCCTDALKGMQGPCDSTISFGGEIRTRYMSEENFSTPGLGLTGNGNLSTGDGPSEFWLNRTRLFTDWKVNSWFRVYAEMIHAEMNGHDHHAARPIEINRHDVQNLFVDLLLFDGDAGQLVFRPGRQELLYGNQRLISPLDWANTRRTFDGLRGLYSNSDWKVDGFFVNPMERPAGAGNFFFSDFDEADDQVKFYGVYAGKKGMAAGAALDFYYLGLDDNSGSNNFSYHTLGFRNAGTAHDLKYELECGYQFGEETDGSSHNAGAVTAGVGHTFASVHKKPTVWFWYDWASGGDTAGQGWHHMYPLAHKYLGFMDLYGRRNIHDINMQFILPVHEKVKFLAWYHHFFMDQATAPSNVNMTVFGGPTNAAGNPGGDKELGQEIDLALTVAINPRQSVLIGYSHFNSGAFYKNPVNTVPFRGDAQFFYAQWHREF